MVAEEFGQWEDSRRRIDLLGLDKGANLVVIELKRTDAGGHMELQAIRYAAMVSTLTFDKLITIYEQHLRENGMGLNAAERLLEFLEWSEPDEEQFGEEVKIVLASAEFSKELTTSVMWLNDFGLDIRCVRMHPYASGGQIVLDVQTGIPIPEVADSRSRRFPGPHPRKETEGAGGQRERPRLDQVRRDDCCWTLSRAEQTLDDVPLGFRRAAARRDAGTSHGNCPVAHKTVFSKPLKGTGAPTRYTTYS